MANVLTESEIKIEVSFVILIFSKLLPVFMNFNISDHFPTLWVIFNISLLIQTEDVMVTLF